MKRFNSIFLLALGAMTLSACETAQEQLGLTREAPDEFKVVKRAPLEMPPSYSLRPPRPGAARPQEQATVDEARETVIGNVGAQATTPAGSESVLLQAAGATNSDPNIRRKVDEESANMVDENQPVIDKLINL